MRPSPISVGTITELEDLLKRQGNEDDMGKRRAYIKAAGFTNNQVLLDSLTDDADRIAWHEGKESKS